jgi:hypothetical protein
MDLLLGCRYVVDEKDQKKKRGWKWALIDISVFPSVVSV